VLGIPNPIDVASALAGNLASDLLSGLAGAVESAISTGARDAINGIISLINNSAGVVSFDPSSWWGKEVGTNPSGTGIWATMVGLGLGTLLICLLLAVIQGARAGDAMLGVRALVVELPASIFGMVAVIGLTTALVSAVDHASMAVLPSASGDFGSFAGTAGVVGLAGGGFFAAVVEALTLLGAIAVWVELVVRAGLIFLLVALSPLALAARVWPTTAGVWKRMVEVGVALILTKFVIALALALGAAALAGSVAGGVSATSATTGAGLMLVAAFSPFVLVRLLPGMESALGAAGVSRMPLRAAQTGLSVAASAAVISRLGAGAGLRAAHGSASGGAASVPPTRPSPGSSLARSAVFDAGSRPAPPRPLPPGPPSLGSGPSPQDSQ